MRESEALPPNSRRGKKLTPVTLPSRLTPPAYPSSSTCRFQLADRFFQFSNLAHPSPPPKSHPPDFSYPQLDIKNRQAEVFLRDADSFLRAFDFFSQDHDSLLPTPAIKNQQLATLSQASAIKHQPHDFFLQEQEIMLLRL